eukprot:TRINITY_DN31819_c0_g1_i1.p1 TRINITY_DN31819_c0_g1~~TRINITY_DN31819_c0_g1_i1.p1  ORF type:complete len:184 (-),score=51.22 TRINITY_DN31819_c0_g1_i1:82-633(-)
MLSLVARSSAAAAMGARSARPMVKPTIAMAYQRHCSNQAGGGGSPNPFSVLEQLGREVQSRASEAAQKIGEVTSTQNAIQELNNFAQSNVEEISTRAVPVFSAFLILARSPGTTLTEEQQAKLAEALPAPALEVLKSFVAVVPEDPSVTQLKRIADRLEQIEAKLDKQEAAAEANNDAEKPSM